MTYYMGRSSIQEAIIEDGGSQSNPGYWQPCSSETLTEAKQEAMRELGHSMLSEWVMIAVGSGNPKRVIARRRNYPSVDGWIGAREVSND